MCHLKEVGLGEGGGGGGEMYMCNINSIGYVFNV